MKNTIESTKVVFVVSSVIVSVVLAVLSYVFMHNELSARNYLEDPWRERSMMNIAGVFYVYVYTYLIVHSNKILSDKNRAARYIASLVLVVVSCFVFTTFHTMLIIPFAFIIWRVIKHQTKD